MKKELYKCLDTYMIRTPLLPLSSFFNIKTDKDLINILADKAGVSGIIKEAISVSSISLNNSLNEIDFNESNQKQSEKVRRALFKYINRMATRCTPYGLMGGINIGAFSNKSNLTMNSPKSFYKRVKPDMEWVMKLIQELQSRLDIVSDLKVVRNNLIYIMGNRYKLPVNKISQNEEDLHNFSFSKNKLTNFILDQCVNPLDFVTLVQLVENEYKVNDFRKVQVYIHSLVENNILLTNLRSDFFEDKPLDHIISVLEGSDKNEIIVRKLKTIVQMISKYNNLRIGDGNQLFNEIVNLMREIVDAKDPLHVDMKFTSEESLEINKMIKEEIEEVSSVMWDLSAHNLFDFSHLKTYKSFFMEKYGVYVEVPILELLDQDSQLGPPPGYPNSCMENKNTNQVKGTKRRKILSDLYYKAILSNEEEIVLTEEILKKFDFNKQSQKRYPSSMELCYSLCYNTIDDIDHGNYTLVASGAIVSNNAGKTFGRFAKLIENDFNDLSKSLTAREKENMDIIYGEVLFNPNKLRFNNLVQALPSREYLINCTEKPIKDFKDHIIIDLKDLLVGFDGNHFYLRSKKYNKVVEPIFSSMVNVNFAPSVVKFIFEISLEKQKILSPFDWDSFNSFVYLPRVRYKNTILSPAKWTLYKNQLSLKDHTFKEWKNEFIKFTETYRVNQFVYLTYIDNKLLIDITNDMHLIEIKKLYDSLKEDGVLIFIEDYTNKFNKDKHAIELVFPLIKIHEEAESTNLQRNTIIINENRIFMPGSEWLFLKLYGPNAREEELIGTHIFELCNELDKQVSINKSFFMRYADPDSHIRLRFNGDPSILSNQLLPTISDWTQKLSEEGLLHKVTIDTYEREIERYGGPGLIMRAEEIFAKDSELVKLWINKKRNKDLGIEVEKLAIISIIDYLESFELDMKEQMNWFDKYTIHKDHRLYFREMKGELMPVIIRYTTNSIGKDSNEIELFQQLRGRRKIIREYLNSIEDHSLLTNTIDDIIASFVHLHLNRLIGLDRKYELKLLTLARHTVKTLNGMLCNSEITRWIGV